MKAKKLKEDLVEEMYEYFDTVHDNTERDEELNQFSDKLQMLLEANKTDIITMLEEHKEYFKKLYTPEPIGMYKSILKTKIETIEECISKTKDLL